MTFKGPFQPKAFYDSIVLLFSDTNKQNQNSISQLTLHEWPP